MKNKVKRIKVKGESFIEESLYNICQWFLETYPEDIFVTKPAEIIIMRIAAKKILAKRKMR